MVKLEPRAVYKGVIPPKLPTVFSFPHFGELLSLLPLLAQSDWAAS